MNDAARRWLEDQHPHGEQDSLAQIEALIDLLGPSPQRIIDLGCGIGRTLVPLTQAGHTLVGMDQNRQALEHCQAALQCVDAHAQLIETDFREPWPSSVPAADMICCLGNTFMTLADVDVAVEVLTRAVKALAVGGLLVMDDCAGEYFSELTNGNWQSGISEDGMIQLVWAPDDAVFALRYGQDVDEQQWTLGPSDSPLRLWTSGTLRLAARAAGLSGPVRADGSGLILMRPMGG
jgi:SAM-dependent methyltransferase